MAKRKTINKIAEILWDNVEKLADKELKKLIKECSILTETNCWFLEYQLKDVVSNLCINQLSSRQHLSKKKQ